MASWIGLTKCQSLITLLNISGFGSAEILRGRPCFGDGNLTEMFRLLTHISSCHTLCIFCLVVNCHGIKPIAIIYQIINRLCALHVVGEKVNLLLICVYYC